MSLKVLDGLTREEFEAMMERCLAQAKAGQSGPIDEVFERLTSEIAEASEDEQAEIWDALTKMTEHDLEIERVTSLKGLIAMRVLQKQAEKNGLSEMTLEEINAEIDAARREHR